MTPLFGYGRQAEFLKLIVRMVEKTTVLRA